jgi:RNA polymerase sigma-70 factor, ECF subfamily
MEPTAAIPQDTELVAEIRRGETAAEATLYEKYSARVYYLAFGELRSHQDAEDVRAETFLRVIQAIREDRLLSPQALASFVFGTAQNVIRESIRRQRRTEAITDEHIEKAGSYVDDDLVADAAVKSAIEQVIRRLKPREQAFLRMYYYEELPREEIVERLGIKEERLRLIKSRALKSFREIYNRLVK